MRSLIPWRRRMELPLTPFWPEAGRLIRRFFGDLEEAAPEEEIWAPRVDVEETEKEIVVKADLPGVEPKDVEVTVSDGALVLRGERKEEHEEKGKNYRRVERFVGKFYRELPLPEGADTEKITATGAHGVLTVIVPRKAEVLPKKIPVKEVPVKAAE